MFCWFANRSLYPEGKDIGKKEAVTPDWQLAVVTSKGIYMRGLSLGGCKASRFLYPARILKSYLEVLSGFSHVYHSDGLNNTLLCQGDSSWNTVIMWAGFHSKGRWGGASDRPGSAHKSTRGHILTVTSSNNL